MNSTDVGATIGLVSLTDRDLEIIAIAMEIAFDGSEDAHVLTGITIEEVVKCEGRIAEGIEEAKTW